MTGAHRPSGRPPEGGLRALSLALTALRRETEDRHAALDAQHAALQAQLDTLVAAVNDRGRDGGDDDEPESWHWDDLSDDEVAARRAELEQWVEHVLRRWHPGHAEAARPCWPRHRPAVAALDAARIAWNAAYRANSRRGTDPAAWLRDWLPALDKQLAAVLGRRQFPTDTGDCAACEKEHQA